MTVLNLLLKEFLVFDAGLIPHLQEIRKDGHSQAEGLLRPHPALKVDDHPLSAARKCLFHIFQTFAAALRP
jgi:hypothetical protein